MGRRHGSGWPVSRREALRGLVGVGAACVACTSHHTAEEERGASAEPPARPVPEWPAGPAAEVVLTIDGGGPDVTWYADGLVLRSLAGATTWASERFLRMPELHLLRLDDGELAQLRGLVGSAEFGGAGSTYLQPKVKDGTHLFLTAGVRRIHIGNRPPDLPDVLTRLQTAYHEIFRRFTAEGVDAFAARQPRLVAVHERQLRARRFADRLTVFANGVLDYRVTWSDAPPGDGESQAPVMRVEQAPVAALADLQAALQAHGLDAVPPLSPDPGDMATSGTTHMIAHAGPVSRIRVFPGHPTPDPMRPVFAAMSELRARFGAPPDEV
jgi:hypothetical protein